MSLSVEPVSVCEVLAESVDLVRHMAVPNRIALRIDDALASPHFVLADRQRLKQVLLNLLSNAIKYNRPDATVTLRTEVMAEERLRICVRDTGHGIPPGKLERLFIPFERLSAEESGVEGTGLGLALSKGLIEAMGGELGVKSTDGDGSTFWVELPLASQPKREPEPIADGRSAPPELEQPGPEPAATHSILFVEDNLANVRLMERIFRLRPRLRLLTAMQGSLGLELAREHRPALILLDLNLPDISGDAVLEQLKQDPAVREIPVVVISGDAIPSQVRRHLDLGATGYVTKPFDVAELLRLLDETVGGEGSPPEG